MQLDASLSWLALGLTPGVAARLSARLLRQFGSPEGVFRASLTALESCQIPGQVARAIVKKESFPRAEKELAGVGKIPGCSLLNWTEPEYPQTLLQIYDPPVLLYMRGDLQVLNFQPQHRGNSPAYALRHANGPAPRPGTRRPRGRRHQRHGPRD
jgi:DNA processing protein